MQTVTNFIVALPSEARPIVQHLGLARDTNAHGVKLYRRDDTRLIVSGVGKIASAAAVGYLAGRGPAETRHIWLNVGIAGHARLARGSSGLAHCITDQATGVSFYPSIVFRPPCPSYALACYDEPTTSYAGEAMCDMESSGFFTAAMRFSSVEFIHALKIVSDNSAADIKALDRGAISTLIERGLDIIESVAAALHNAHETHRPATASMDVETLLSRWHFTATQKTQLLERARRWALTRPGTEWPWDTLARCRNSREVLALIEAELDTTPLRLGLPAAR